MKTKFNWYECFKLFIVLVGYTACNVGLIGFCYSDTNFEQYASLCVISFLVLIFIIPVFSIIDDIKMKQKELEQD